MTFLQRFAIYVTVACLMIIYAIIGVLPIFLYWVTWSPWWFLLYLLICPGMLLVAATVQQMAINQKKQGGAGK